MVAELGEYFDPLRFGCSRHPSARDCAVSLVHRYITSYAGAMFDPRGDEPWWDPDRITSNDLRLVAMLSMPRFMSGAFINGVMPEFQEDLKWSVDCHHPHDCVDHVHCLLRRVPARSTIFDDRAGDDLELMTQIWHLIRKNPILVASKGFGNAGLSKLLARKRPALVPITDSVAIDRIKRVHPGRSPASIEQDSWQLMRAEVLSDRQLPGHIVTVRSDAGVPPWISDLRVIDIVVWMRDNEHC